MKTAILFALVCLFGYTLADFTCTESCKDLDSENISGVITDGGVTYIFEKTTKFTVVIRGNLAYLTNGKVIILVNKSTGVIFHIDGCKGRIVKDLQVDINLLFNANGQITGAIRNIVDASATATIQFTIEWGIALKYKSKAEIDFVKIFGGNKDAGAIGKSDFAIFFEATVEIIGKKGSNGVTQFTLVAGVVVTSEDDHNKAVLLGIAFAFVSNTPEEDVQGGFSMVLKVIVNGKKDEMCKLGAVIRMRKRLVVDVNMSSIIFSQVKIPSLLSKALYVTFYYHAKNLDLTYYLEGAAEKTVSIILTVNTDDAKKNELCVINGAVNYNVLIKSGFFLLFSRNDGTYMFFSGSDVELGGAMTSVDVAVYFSVAVALDASKKVAVTDLVEKCIKSTEAELTAYLQTAVHLQVDIAVKVSSAFGAFLKKHASKTISLFKTTYFVTASICVEFSMNSYDSESASFGVAISAATNVVKGISSSISTVVSTAFAASLTASFGMSINFSASS